MVLLVAALLFARSCRNLLTSTPGIRENNITIGYFGFPSAGIKMDDLAQLVDAVRAIPGVENAAVTTRVPQDGGVSASFESVGEPSYLPLIDGDVETCD